MHSHIIVPQSRIAIWHASLDGRRVNRRWSRNNALAAWGYAAARALGEGGDKWRIRKVYLEFENVEEPEDPVSVPIVTPMDPAHGLPYYLALQSSPSRDFLRLDLISTPIIGVEEGYEAVFESGEGNLLTLHAQSGGSTGVFGKEFSDAANSKVCGTALVVAPVEQDETRDIVIARGYFPADEQLLKSPGLQFGATWEIPFVLPA